MAAGNAAVFAAIAEFRRRLREEDNLPLFGTSVQLTDPTSTDALADSLDWFWFDQEHAPMSPEVLKTHMLVAHGRGKPCIVRISAPNIGGSAGSWGTYLKAALDNGADGVIVPQIRTADDVRAIVADCRYPTGGFRPAPNNVRPASVPEGLWKQPARHDTSSGSTAVDFRRRGFGPTTPTNYGRLDVEEYLARADANIFVCVMIETLEVRNWPNAPARLMCIFSCSTRHHHRCLTSRLLRHRSAQAIQNIDAICSVDGLDAIVIGANDLTGSMGIPYVGGAEEAQEAIDHVIATARRRGKTVCFSSRNLSLSVQVAKKGVDLLHIGNDIQSIIAAQDLAVSTVRAAL